MLERNLENVGRRAIPALAGALALAFGSLATAQDATGPAFDCDKAESDTEKLICSDSELGRLDRQLDAAYREALGKARDDMPQVLRAEQRGWIKGRDECWKAQEGSPAFLTASWQVASQRECVAGQYALRISELQARWQLAPSRGPVFYACENDPRNELVATYHETDPKTVSLERGDRAALAWLVPSDGGAKYEGQNVELRPEGDALHVTWLGEELTCNEAAQ